MIHVLVTKVDERSLGYPFRPPVLPVRQVLAYDVLRGKPLLHTACSRLELGNHTVGQVYFTWYQESQLKLGIVQMCTIALLDSLEGLFSSTIVRTLQPHALEIGWVSGAGGWSINRETLTRGWEAPVEWDRSTREIV